MVKAKKQLGQNFLHDQKVLQNILTAGELSSGDNVVEVGPGTGALTRGLIQSGAKVIAIELDRDLIPWLKINFGKASNFELVEGNALHTPPPHEPYKLIANIPYYITSPLLNHYLREQYEHNGNPPTLMVLMVQKEVAGKIIAEDGKHSLLSLEVQLFGEVEKVCDVPKTAFKPIPDVDSAVIKIRPFKEPRINGKIKQIFWLFYMSLAQKRKKLSNNLATAFQGPTTEIRDLMEKASIPVDIRAEDLSWKEWGSLFSALHSRLPSFEKPKREPNP